MAFALRLTALARLGSCGGVSASGGASKGRRLISLTSLCQAKVVPYKLADIGEGIREVTVKEWFIKEGDKVNQFDQICEVQSDKASVTITSRFDGIVKAVHYKVDDTCLVGSALIDIEIEGNDDAAEEGGSKDSAETNSSVAAADAATEDSGPAGAAVSEDEVVRSFDKVLTTPAVRKIAKENNVNLAQVPSTGKDGRVLKEDILAYLGKVAQKIDAEATSSRAVAPTTGGGDAGGSVGRTISEKKYAKHMWKTMTQSLSIPHFVYSDECDVSKLMKLRIEVKEAFKSQGLSLSYMPFFIKAISRALLEYPELNAWVDEKTESVDIRNEHNIALAMDTPGGLIVPNIKNVQNLSIVDIAKELNRMQALGKKSSIPPNDLIGGTFSLSNIGIVGGTYTKPVILPPQVVIGALGKIQKVPRFDEQENVIAANILNISWAADHRVVDGVTMAKFSNLWKHYVENPSHLILGI